MNILFIVFGVILITQVQGIRQLHSKEEILNYKVDPKGLVCAHEVVIAFLHTHPKMLMWITKFENNRLFLTDALKYCKKLGAETENCIVNWKIAMADGLNQIDEEATLIDPANEDEKYTKQLLTAIDKCYPESKL